MATLARSNSLHQRTGQKVASLHRKRLGARKLGRRRALQAEAFSIRRLEGSRWRLRRTRQLWGLKAALIGPFPMCTLPSVSAMAGVGLEMGWRCCRAPWEARLQAGA